jgi:DNA-binding CsgD family transcriptional regulator
MDFTAEELLGESDISHPTNKVLRPGAERLGSLGTWAWRPSTAEVAYSENLLALIGLGKDDSPLVNEEFLARVHPLDRPNVGRAIYGASASPPAGQRYRILRADSEIRYLESITLAVVERAPSLMIVGCTRDLTQAVLATREIASRTALTSALARWRGIAASGGDLLAAIGGPLGMDWGALWLAQRGALQAAALWGSVPGRSSSALAGNEPSAGQDLATLARELGEPVFAPGRAAADGPDSERAAGLKHALAIPFMNGDLGGAVGFGSAFPFRVTERLQATLAAAGRELGEFFVHRRADLRPPILTAREKQVLELAADGCNGPEIARRLCISRTTVKSHFDHIFAKYGVRDRAGAVARALREGTIE